jgi:riboflavin transporter FmnP
MSKINLGRVVLGGIVAGIIIDVVEFVLNGVVLAPQWTSVMQSLNRPAVGMNQIIWFNIIGLASGLAAVWTYAAMRPRFGAGVMTAAYAGILIWFVGYALPDLGNMIVGIYPSNMTTMLVAVGLAEAIVATIAGAFLYKEA